MSKLVGAVSLAAGIIFAGAPASAADFNAPAPEAVSTWTGFYLGVGGGGRWADFDINTTSCETGHVPPCNFESNDGIFGGYAGPTYEIYDFNLNDSGIFGTAQAGFNVELAPSIVLGAFVSGDLGNDLKDSRFNQVNYGGVDPDSGQAWSASVGNIFTLGARAGFAPSETWMLYGLAGWSWAKADASYFEGCDFSNNGGSCTDLRGRNSDTVDGLTLGAGAEVKVSEHVSLGVEYRHTDFGSVNVSTANGPFTGDTSTDIVVQSVRALLNFHF